MVGRCSEFFEYLTILNLSRWRKRNFSLTFGNWEYIYYVINSEVVFPWSTYLQFFYSLIPTSLKLIFNGCTDLFEEYNPLFVSICWLSYLGFLLTDHHWMIHVQIYLHLLCKTASKILTENFQVIWIEHMEYDENTIHNLYRPFIRSGRGFGAQRWIATLQRQCECLAVITSSAVPSGDSAGTTSYCSFEILKP